MKNPKILYHASQNRNLKIIKPKNKSSRDKNEGKVIFATSSKALASCFIVPTDDSWTNIGIKNGKTYILISDKKRFLELDKGGVIYSISSESFNFDENLGMKEMEWTSKKPIKILDREVFTSGLEAMKKLGVEIKFIDKKVFEKLNKEQIKISEVLK